MLCFFCCMATPYITEEDDVEDEEEDAEPGFESLVSDKGPFE